MPFISYEEARDEILSYFTTEWNLQASPLPIFYADKHKELPGIDPLNPLSTQDHIRVRVVHNDEIQRTLGGIGQRRYEQFGIIVVEIHVKPGDGLQDSDAFAKIAVDIFRGKSTGSDRVLFTRSRMNEIGTDGGWNQTNVTVDFRYDLIA